MDRIANWFDVHARARIAETEVAHLRALLVRKNEELAFARTKNLELLRREHGVMPRRKGQR